MGASAQHILGRSQEDLEHLGGIGPGCFRPGLPGVREPLMMGLRARRCTR